jgi:hypothetical protein
MAVDVGVEEVSRLARAMTLKNAAAGLPHGGGKSAIVADPGCPPERKERLIRTFAAMIAELTEYIPGFSAVFLSMTSELRVTASPSPRRRPRLSQAFRSREPGSPSRDSARSVVTPLDFSWSGAPVS